MRRFLRYLWPALVGTFCAVGIVWAGVTITEDKRSAVKKITFDWLTDLTGTVAATTAHTYTGQILLVVHDPDPATDAPAKDYRVRLANSASYDLVRPLVTAWHFPSDRTMHVATPDYLGVVSNSAISIEVSQAGAAKAGVTTVWLR